MWRCDVTTSATSSARNVNNPGNNSPGSVSQFKGWKWITRSGWVDWLGWSVQSYNITGRAGLYNSGHTRLHTNNNRNIFSSSQREESWERIIGIFSSGGGEGLKCPVIFVGAILGVLLLRSWLTCVSVIVIPPGCLFSVLLKTNGRDG